VSEPAREPVPELDAEDAMRGVVSQLFINGQRMPVIIPGSVIKTLRLLAGLLARADMSRYLLQLIPVAMPWARPLPADDLAEFGHRTEGSRGKR
jgi:hypothetical protein